MDNISSNRIGILSIDTLDALRKLPSRSAEEYRRESLHDIPYGLTEDEIKSVVTQISIHEQGASGNSAQHSRLAAHNALLNLGLKSLEARDMIFAGSILTHLKKERWWSIRAAIYCKELDSTMAYAAELRH